MINLGSRKKVEGSLSPFGAESENSAIVDERYVELQLKGENRLLRYALFTGVRFEDCEIEHVDFSHSVFVDCYFRHTTFDHCDFKDCRFTGCEFRKVQFTACKFAYSRWSDTAIPFATLSPHLPYEWPNVCHEVLESLRTNAITQGDGTSARSILFESMNQRRRQLWATVRYKEDYFKTRFSHFDRVGAFFRLVVSHMERWMWGYGESLLQIGLLGLVLVVAFAGWYLGVDAGAFGFDGSAASIVGAATEALLHSARGFAGTSATYGGSSDFQIPSTIQAVLGIVYTGVLAAVVYRWISIRQS